MSNAQDQLKLYLEYFFSESYDNVYNICYDSSNRDHILSNLKQLGKNKINDSETLAEFRSFVADNFVDMGFFDFFDKLEEYIQIQNKIICLLYGVEMKKEYGNLSALKNYMKEMSACIDECKQLFTKIEKNITPVPIVASEPESIIPESGLDSIDLESLGLKPLGIEPEPITPESGLDSIDLESLGLKPLGIEPKPITPEPITPESELDSIDLESLGLKPLGIEPEPITPEPTPTPEPIASEPIASEPVVSESSTSDVEIDYDAIYGDRKSYQLLMKEVETALGVINLEIKALSKKEDRTFSEEVKLRKLIKDKATLKNTAIQKYIEKYDSKFNRVSKFIDQRISAKQDKIQKLQDKIEDLKEQSEADKFKRMNALKRKLKKDEIPNLEYRIAFLNGSIGQLSEIQYDLVQSKFNLCSLVVSSLNKSEAKKELKAEKDPYKAAQDALKEKEAELKEKKEAERKAIKDAEKASQKKEAEFNAKKRVERREIERNLRSLERTEKMEQIKGRFLSAKDQLFEKIEDLKRKRAIAQSGEPIQQQLNNEDQNHMTR